MSQVKKVFAGPLGKKFLMALTGLFLITFLVVHLAGNLQLLKDDGGYAFNQYAVFMTSNPLIKTVSYVLYTSILAHVIISLILTIKNQKARPEKYRSSGSQSTSVWQSRNMGILGTIILIFLAVHLQGFWAKYKMDAVPYAKYEVSKTGEVSKTVLLETEVTEEMKKEEGVFQDLYIEVATAFKVWWIVAIYVLSMIGMAFHLSHGFQSAFQTLGINHTSYTPAIKFIGTAFSIIISALFAWMPIYFFFIH